MNSIFSKLSRFTTTFALAAVFYSTLEITAYYQGNVTCNGTTPIPYYTCAADHLPPGTKVTVGNKVWVVDDCFGGGYTNKLDLFMPDYDSCIQWGRRTMECKIETPE